MALADIASRTNLDPLVLSLILETKAQDQRARLPGELQATIDAAFDRFSVLLPSVEQAYKYVQAVIAVTAVAQRIERSVGRVMSKMISLSVVLAIAMLTLIEVVHHRSYDAGYADRSNSQACYVLHNVVAIAKNHHRSETAFDVKEASLMRGC
jgi:hypothetical protein